MLDDKAQLPLACTHKDGSENERRSNIMRLFSNFQVEITRKEISDAANAAGCDSQMNVVPATKDTIMLKEPQLLPSVQQPSLSTPMREVRILPGEGMVFICNIIQL